MAKALYGHLAAAPAALSAEVAGLRRRVRDLEAELARLRAENAALAAAAGPGLRVDEMIDLEPGAGLPTPGADPRQEPALT